VAEPGSRKIFFVTFFSLLLHVVRHSANAGEERERRREKICETLFVQEGSENRNIRNVESDSESFEFLKTAR